MAERYSYTYDNWGRPLTVTHALSNRGSVPTGEFTYTVTKLLHDYEYDFAGRMVLDKRNGADALKTRFDYNVRSALTGIGAGWNATYQNYGDTFLENLTYHWGGNICSMDWMCGSDGVTRTYNCAYDGLSRLTGAAYSDNLSAPGTYSRGYTYDLHGNILSVATPTDTTAVSYTGNQRSGNFTYDANGNMTADPEAGLTGMTYNVLNLLSGYNAANNRQVVLTYSASGEKLSEQEKVSGLIESEKKYFGNLVYEGLALYPNRLLIDGGYVDITTTNNSSNYTYRYYVQDHLGNNRLVTDDSGTILQTNHYDPYGQLLSDISSSTPVSQYKYANKEWDTATASYDFGARRYTPAVPRWTAIDPLAEKYYAISPYVYCAGNPVNLVDINGEKIRIWYTEEGVKKCFTYSGVETDIPQNEYVHSVIEAYQFNKANWESQGYTIECPSTIMVEDTVIEINVFSDFEFDSMYYRENGGRQSLIWNAYEGLETNNKIILSPATLFVHEADHAMDDFRDAKAHSERVLKKKVDYTNEEEYRVINGSEQLSAIANGDIKAGGRTRNAHKGTLVYTISPTSNIIDKAATRYFYKHYTKKH